ncbi:MAG: hypothetical protein HY376_00585 [Candidatus Blackburnbacteria bacterium]|nr:hypothetical protein [Candidatus Blackburnbacteria bacterium]
MNQIRKGKKTYTLQWYVDEKTNIRYWKLDDGFYADYPILWPNKEVAYDRPERWSKHIKDWCSKIINAEVFTLEDNW